MAGLRVLVPGVDDRAGNALVDQGLKQRLLVEYRAAPHIDDDRVRPHRRQRLPADQAPGLLAQGQGEHDGIGRGHELVQALERPELVHARMRHRAAVASMHPHAKSLGPLGHGTAYMAQADHAQGLRAQFGAQRMGCARPVSPALLAQIGVGLLQRHMAGEQGGHHIFGNRVFMPKAVAQRAVRRQQGGIDCVGAGRRRQIELERLRTRQVGLQPNADNHIGRLKRRPFAGTLESVTQGLNLMACANERFHAGPKLASIGAMKNNAQLSGAHLAGSAALRGVEVRGLYLPARLPGAKAAAANQVAKRSPSL